jgi:hypothetical protein
MTERPSDFQVIKEGPAADQFALGDAFDDFRRFGTECC